MAVYHVTLGAVAADGAEAYERYSAAVLPLIAEYGGTLVARGPQIAALEGSDLPEFIAVIQFADSARAHAMLDDVRYLTAKTFRSKAFRDYRTMLVDPM